MASIPSNGYNEVMSGTNNYTGSNSFDGDCPQTPNPPSVPNDLTNKLYVDTLVGPPSGVGLSQILTVGNNATGQDIQSVNNMTVQNIALNSVGSITTVSPFRISQAQYNQTCVMEGNGISMLATPSIGELEINNQGIGADISINTSNNAPKGQFRVRCPAVIQSIRDRNGSLGTAGQVLSSIGGDDFTSLLEWTTPTPAGGGNLQTTLDAGNTATGANANITLTDTQQGGALNPILTLNNTNATGSVAMEIYKNKPTAGVAGDVLFNQSVFGKDAGNSRQEYTRITHTIRDSATGGEDGSIEMGCFVQGSINTFLQLNGNENEVNCLKNLDMGGNAILSRTGDITIDTGFNNTGNGDIVLNSVGAIGLGNIDIKAKSIVNITGQSVSMVSTFGTDIAAVGTTNTGLLQLSATQGINITGNALQSGTSGGNSGQHLVITLNGLPYKIALQNP